MTLLVALWFLDIRKIAVADTEKKKVSLPLHRTHLCKVCTCGAKDAQILEITDTHVVRVNFLGVRERISIEDYEASLEAENVYTENLNEYLSDTLPEKMKKRRKRLKVSQNASEAPVRPRKEKETVPAKGKV